MSRVGGAAARVALAATLLDAATGVPRAAPASEVVCTISGTADDVSVRIAAAGRRLALAEHVAEAVPAAGLSCREGDRGLTLTFPRGGPPAKRTERVRGKRHGFSATTAN